MGNGPFGYIYGPRNEKGRLTVLPHEPEQAVIAQIREWAAAKHSTRAIARLLNEAGVPTKLGRGKRQWEQHTVCDIMKREKIAPCRPCPNPHGRRGALPQAA